MSVPQCVEPGNFNTTNNPLPYKNACVLGGPININDPTIKNANQQCCEETGGIVRADNCYLVCQFNLLYPMHNWESCLADKFKTTPAPMGIKEQCFGTLFENPNTNDTDTLTFTPSSTPIEGGAGTSGPFKTTVTATPTDGGLSATQTASPSKTTISLSPTSSLTVSAVIIGGAPKPTASSNSSTPASGSNSSSTTSASPSSITPPSKASRGSISMGAVFVVGLAFIGLMI